MVFVGFHYFTDNLETYISQYIDLLQDSSSSYFYKPSDSTSGNGAVSSIYKNTAYFPSQKIKPQSSSNFFVPNRVTTSSPTFLGSTFKRTTIKPTIKENDTVPLKKGSPLVPYRKRNPQDQSAINIEKKKNNDDNAILAQPRTTPNSLKASNGVEKSTNKSSYQETKFELGSNIQNDLINEVSDT